MKNIVFPGMVHVIGAGGVGSWLVPSLCKLVGPDHVTVYDGDTLEPKNMDRQLFNKKHIGRNKAEALTELYGCNWVDKYFSEATREFPSTDFIICCADNNPARVACLSAGDNWGCKVIIAANEKHSAEAYYYDYDWMEGTDMDPLVFYPNMIDDHAGDPRSKGAGCTGEVQEQTPQLVSANFMAAALAQWLFVLWGTVAPTLRSETLDKLPYHLIGNMSGLEIKKVTRERTVNESE